MSRNNDVLIIGGGLAGSEAAWLLANRGFHVTLADMKPEKLSPAHHDKNALAELVCSNSLKSNDPGTASGLLKAEMRLLGSLIAAAADSNSVPAGGALAVDRDGFSAYITQKLRDNKNIDIISKEIDSFPEKDAVICTGPLTSDKFSAEIAGRCGNLLSFYDAAAPIVTADSIDKNIVFTADRYGKGQGDGDYLNCGFSREQYDIFYEALVTAKTAELHSFDTVKVYEGCMPVEVLAKRGRDAVRYGCMKPVGLTDPATGRRPYAVAQLRKENAAGTLYNLVGFQTNLTFSEQKRVFSLIPGLADCEFARYGVMHRNSFLCSPALLEGNFRLKDSDRIYFAGQITGVEGYCESAASGIIAALDFALGCAVPPETTMIGALRSFVIDSVSSAHFQPMGVAMGLLPDLPGERIRDKKARYAALSARALADMKRWRLSIDNL